MGPLRIGCITSDPAHAYGASRSLLGLLNTLSEKTHHISLAVVTPGAIAASRGRRHCLALLSHVERRWFLHSSRTRKLMRLAWETSALMRRAVSFLRSTQSQVAYINTITFGSPALAARLARVPCVIHFREPQEYTTGDNFVAKWRIWAIRFTQPRVIAISGSAAESAHSLGIARKHIRVVHNAIDTEHYKPRTLPPNRFFTITCVTRISHEKGVDNLLRAAQIVLERSPDTRFVIVGGPVKSAYFDKAIRPLLLDERLRSQCTFTGEVDDPRDFLASTDVVAVPSLMEAFGRVNIEAMAMGKPVVATDAGGIPEVVKNGVTGLVVPRNNATRFADALCELITDRERCEDMGRAGRKEVEEHFSLNQHAHRISQLLTDAATGRW